MRTTRQQLFYPKSLSKMKSFRKGLFFALLVSMCLALPGQTVCAQSTGSITGTVRGPGGTPVSGATIMVSTGNLATSAADGTYTITGLTPGSYRVGAGGNGWGTQYYNNTANVNEATAVTVTSGSTTSGIDFNLVVGGSITGTIRGPGGTPVQGISVSTEGASGLLDVYSAADGTYTITGLQPGNHVVYARGNGVLAMQYYNNTTSSNNATPVSVVSGGTTSGIDFNLVVGGTITGTVMANGIPLANVSVATQYGSATSAADGTYTITGHPAGSYAVQAYGSGWATQYYNLVYSHSSATAVSVTSGGTTSNINFNLVAVGTITGTVVANGSSLAGASVCATGAYNYCATSAANGTYTITELPPGNYTVYASGSGWAKQYYNLVHNSQTATAVSVTSGVTTSNINFNLVAVGTITGTVRGPGGTPLQGVQVSASNTGSSGYATTAADGTYTIAGLDPASYRLQAYKQGYPVQSYDHADSIDTETAVTVTSGGITSGINFDLIAGGTITGIVRGPGGTPLEGAGILAWGPSWNWNPVFTAADGTYTITGLTAGLYQVISEASGYANQYYNNADSSSTATAVAVTNGGTTSNINFNLVAGGTITGTVRGPGGVPVANVMVFPSKMPGSYRFGNNNIPYGFRTSADGTYTITGLSAGNYLVHTMSVSPLSCLQFYDHADSSSAATAITVTSGGTTSNIDFNLVEGGGTIQGRITLPGGLPCPSCGVTIFDAASGSAIKYFVLSATSSSDGSYESQPLPAGSYKVGASNNMLALLTGTSYFWPATTSIDSALLVPVTAGAATPNINIELKPFIFTDQTGVARSTVVTSNSIFAWWMNTDAIISITGGVYSVNGGAYTSAPGTVIPGNSVKVRQTSSSSYGATTNATLTIGGISDTFSVTTAANTPPVIPAPTTSGIEGTSITINGSNFGAVQSGSYVDFNGVQGTIVYWSDRQIVVIVPPGATSGPMRVVTSQGASSNMSFTVYPPECAAPVKVAGSNYYTIQDAYNNAASGSTVQITEGLFNTGNLDFNRNISTRVTGGYDCGYSAQTGYSAVDGSVTIKNGSVTVDGVIIK